jgi:proline racemase
MSEKKKYFADNFDHIRKLLMFEPRGHKNMCGAVLTEPTRKDCNFGVIFLDSGGYLDMCIHGIIGIVKVLLETGISQKKEKATKICLDTPVGHVTAVASVKNGRVRDIAVFNVPSFLAYSDVKIEVPEVGIINVDIAFGGNFFAIVNASELGIEVQARNMRKLVEIGLTIRDIVNQEIKVIHPRNKYANKVNLVEICGKPKKSKATYRNIVVFGAGQVDRSPCGTGMSAKIATLYTKGLLKVGEQIISESIIGTLFKGKVLSETKVGRFKAVMPEISGSAYITSFNQFVIDPDDPLKAGFLI